MSVAFLEKIFCYNYMCNVHWMCRVRIQVYVVEYASMSMYIAGNTVLRLWLLRLVLV